MSPTQACLLTGCGIHGSLFCIVRSQQEPENECYTVHDCYSGGARRANCGRQMWFIWTTFMLKCSVWYATSAGATAAANTGMDLANADAERAVVRVKQKLQGLEGGKQPQ